MKFYRVKTSNPNLADKYYASLELAVSFFVSLSGGFAINGIDVFIEEFELGNSGEYKLEVCHLEFKSAYVKTLVRSTEAAKLLRKVGVAFEFAEYVFSQRGDK
jgi:hypothetical protein